jgi:serine/threonine-protein kinase
MITPCPSCGTINGTITPPFPETVTCAACGCSFDPTVLGSWYRVGQIMRIGLSDTVHEGRDIVAGSPVAIRIPACAETGPEKSRWLGLARQLARLEHPSVVPLGAVGDVSGRLYYHVSALPEGTSLLEKLVERRPSVEAAITLVVDLAEVLHFVHERWSMVHGDLNPRAVVVRASGPNKEVLKPSILAVCLSKQEFSENATGMRSPLLSVTPYTSPEQRGGAPQRVDVRSDVFSLGAILYRLVFGSQPPAPSGRAAVSRGLSLAEEGALLPPLQRVIARAMAEDPRERYESAAHLAGDLQRLGQSQ